MKYKIVWRIKKRKVRRKSGSAEYVIYKNKARKLANERIMHFNSLYQFKINRIAIKNQKSRWGSCSKKGNLNFNYRIALLPQRLSDYVILHELCHLGEFNHSKNFWKLMEKAMPDYQSIKEEFKSIRIA